MANVNLDPLETAVIQTMRAAQDTTDKVASTRPTVGANVLKVFVKLISPTEIDIRVIKKAGS